MEWSNETVMNFIEDYRKNPILWDSRLAQYRNLGRKKIVLRRVAQKYSCSIDDIKKKIKSLRTSFRREYWKLRNIHVDDGDEDKIPKWFAYNALKFLLFEELPYGEEPGCNYNSFNVKEAFMKCDTVFPNDNKIEEPQPEEEEETQQIPEHQLDEEMEPAMVHIEDHDIHRNNEDNDQHTNLSETVDYVSQSPVADVECIVDGSVQSVQIQNTNTRRKRRYVRKMNQNSLYSGRADKTTEEAYNFLKTHYTTKDEFDHFARNIAIRLRNLKTDRAKSCAQHLISNIIFQAEMGKYDNGITEFTVVNHMPVSSTSTSNPTVVKLEP